MPKSIISFLKKYGDISFGEKPFGAVDALILSQFSYLKMKTIVGDLKLCSRSVTLEEFAFELEDTVVFADTRFAKNNRCLLQEMAEGKRYKTMRLCCHVDWVDSDKQMQFSAITCILSTGSVKVVFRGTDETLVGWREDFNMSFLYPVPGQYFSALYLTAIAQRVSSTFDIIGHSKGGNLAVYAAMHVEDTLQERITHIYNMDGPGFRPEVYEMFGYEKISSKIIKLIPKSSFFGMILENHHDYKVVDSRSIGILQHDPYNWIVEDDDFTYSEKLHEGRRLTNEILNLKLLSMEEAELKLFTEALFHILEATEATTLLEFTQDIPRCMKGIAKGLHSLQPEMKNTILSFMLDFIRGTRDSMVINVLDRLLEQTKQ
ncbi:MAG: Mbeg1-like protein [Lachnospiraceae bacterium]